MSQFRNSLNLRGLQTFEAVARHRSMTRAAEELGLTQSAVSHQIRRLAVEVGEKLIERRGRSIDLTAVGHTLASELHGSFERLRESTRRAITSQPQRLRLAVCSAFSTGWLLPRMGRFATDNPAIDLQLLMYAQDPEKTDLVADAFITTLPTQGGFVSVPLIMEQLVAVERKGARASPTSTLPATLVTTELEPSRIGSDWIKFCDLAAIDLGDKAEHRWLQCSHYILAAGAARIGLGAALVPEFMVQDDLRTGALTLLSPVRMPTAEDYYLCYKTARRSEDPLRRLHRWLETEAPGF